MDYIEVADRTGGVFADICTASFTQAMLAFGDVSFGSRAIYRLSRPALPDGVIVVTVGGSPCTSGWSLTSDGYAVRFDAESPCFPDPGGAVEVTFEPVCN